ncbi:phosphotransferase [Paenibacillus sp. GCM10027628]|uniref:phosphotransferase n=1 Tax=Paenibacillus sp. GCM10027628 TaxID=3273413 RepID=UPI00362F7212
MLGEARVNGIMKELHEKGIFDSDHVVLSKMKGTTEGLIYIVSENNESKYVLKLDHPEQINLAELFLQTYQRTSLLPKLLYTDPAKTFIVYSFLQGATHYNRGSKKNWLPLLVKELINHYVNEQEADRWDGLKYSHETWREYNEQSVEEARMYIGNLLPLEDYHQVKLLVEKTAMQQEDEAKYLLHGDMGVHNFVFHQEVLTGVIDPSPMVGPVHYDFLYAFCSSPDDLNLETLLPAFQMLKHGTMGRSHLIEEVIIQLYCRIGLSCKHHPHDLPEYLKAWEYWKGRI